MQHNYTYMSALSVILVSGAALGQAIDQIEEVDEAKQVEVIQVTATRRTESIQEVPIAMSAYGADFIERAGITDMQELGAYVPNLTLTRSSQVASNRIAIRGVGTSGSNGLEPSVAVFIDGVYIPRPGAIVGKLEDIEAVEVLRGPQGTLFGRNASMGALNIRTAKAAGDNTTRVWAGIGSDSLHYGGVTLDRALNESVSGRMSMHYSKQDGFAYSEYSETDIGRWQDIGVRGSLVFPIGKADASLRADWKRINNNGSASSVIADSVQPRYLSAISFILDPEITPDKLVNGFTGPLPNVSNEFDRRLNQIHEDDAVDEQRGLSLDVAWDHGQYSYRSITAMRKWDNFTYETPIRLPAELLPRVTDYAAQTFSQELQLLSSFDGPFNYVAGLYYYQESYDIDQWFNLGADFCSLALHNNVWNTVFRANLSGGVDTATAFGNALNTAGAAAGACLNGPQTQAILSNFSQDVKSMSVFAQGTYDITDQASAIIGVRYTNDDKTGYFVNDVRNNIAGPRTATNPFGINLRVNESSELAFKDDQVTWLATLRYAPTNDFMTFLTASTGYKGGGFNTESGSEVLGDKRVFDSETVTNLEWGFKSWFLGLGTVNATLFRTNLKNFQDRRFDGVTFVVLNAAELRQQGVEVDANLYATNNLSVMLSGSYLDSKFLDYRDGTNLPGFPSNIQQDLTGTPNNFSPRWQFSNSMEWRDYFGQNKEWFVRGEYQYLGKRRPSGVTDNNPSTMRPGYGLVNLRLGISDDLGAWDLTLFAKNLLDKGYCQAVTYQPLNTTLGLVDPTTGDSMARCYQSQPRQLGLEFRYNFE